MTFIFIAHTIFLLTLKREEKLAKKASFEFPQKTLLRGPTFVCNFCLETGNVCEPSLTTCRQGHSEMHFVSVDMIASTIRNLSGTSPLATSSLLCVYIT